MKLKLGGAIAALAVFAAGGAAHATCVFFDDINFGGASFTLQDGQCALLAGNTHSACRGPNGEILTSTIIAGWNDRISSVQVSNGSAVSLMENADASGQNLFRPGSIDDLVRESFNDTTSIAICVGLGGATAPQGGSAAGSGSSGKP